MPGSKIAPNEEAAPSEPVALRLGARAWLTGLALVTAVWAVASLWWPYGGDQGCFGFLGHTLLRGGQPYREAWDFKGPLGFYVFAGLELVFGRQMWAVRVLDLVLLGAAGLASVRLLERYTTRRVAVGTTLMIVLAFASFGSWYTAQPDGWAALLLVVASERLLRASPTSVRDAVIASAILGVCTLIKPLYGLYALLVACAMWPVEARDRRAAWRGLGLAAAAFFLPIAAMAAWLGSRGVLGDMIDVHVRFNMERLRTDAHLQMGLGRVVACIVGIFTSVPILTMVLPPAVLGVGVLAREKRRAAVVLVAWVGVSLCLIGAQKKFLLQNYSWHPLFPPLGLLAGIGLGSLWRVAVRELAVARFLVVATLLLLVKQVTKEPLAHAGRWLRLATGRVTLAQYRAEFDENVPALNGGSAVDVGFSVERDVEIARWVDERTHPDDEVSIWIDPLANYLGDRPTITPITVAAAFTTWGSPERRARYRTDLLERLQSPKAAYFGVPQHDLEPGNDDDNLPTRFPELLAALDAHYDKVEKVGDVQMFKHRTPAP
jgi:hypothetical protein